MSKHYNGFTPAQRSKAGRWAKKEQAAGRRTTPTVCLSCGQTEGLLMRHSEDYNEPYGDHIGRFRLCYVCHMWIHCRHHDVERWREYVDMVKRGARPLPFASMNFQRFAALYLRGPKDKQPFSWHEPPKACQLAEIPDEQRDIARRPPQGEIFDGGKEEGREENGRGQAGAREARRSGAATTQAG